MKKRILVIDDDPDLAILLNAKIEPESCEIIPVYTGKEGLKKAKQEKPDLIVLDLMLPEMNGYKVCELLKNGPETKHIPVIMFTSREDDDEIKLGKEVGADIYLTKTLESRELIPAIKKLIG